jgi:hypothetical protein
LAAGFLAGAFFAGDFFAGAAFADFFTTFFTGAREAVFFATAFLVGVFFVVLALDGIAVLLAFLRTVLAEASS